MTVARQIISKQIIKVCIQLAGCHNGRILQLQCSRSCVAGISEQRFFAGFSFFVQFLKHHPRHQNLPTNFKCFMIPLSMQHQRDTADGLYIACHIISLHTIATRHGAHQFSVLISQRDGSSIILHFTTNFKILVQRLLYPVIKLGYFRFRIGVSQ